MECNRDEAVRAKQMAEKKLLGKDILGSRKLALKAQSLFPELQGLSQFLEIVDVCMAHNQTINGEPNYYRVLGVDPSSDDELLKKQYRRKALSLHPDKNKSVGAEGAFIILSEAWRVLSDKESRNAYNMKLFNSFSLQSTPGSGTTSQPFYSASASHPGRNTAFQHPASHAPAVSSRYTPPSCYPGSTMHTAPAGSPYGPPQSPVNPTPPPGPRKRKTPTRPASAAQFVPASRPHIQGWFVPLRNQPTSSTCPSGSQTFWTVCIWCHILFEYKKVYLNQNLRCRRCNLPFLATEIPAPIVNSSNPWPIPPQQQGVAASSSGPERRHETVVNPERDADRLMKSSSAQPKNVETAPASCSSSGGLNSLKKEEPAKKRQKYSQSCRGSKEGNLGTTGSSSGVKGPSTNVRGSGDEQLRTVDELSQLEIRAMLMGKAKMEILHRLNKWESEKLDSSRLKKVAKRDPVVRTCKSKDDLPSDPKNASHPPGSSTLEDIDFDAPDEFVSMVVPDANFHNFDNDRVDESFIDGQVWAVYDDDDGMPRYYALVHHVISRSPLMVQIRWLNSKTSSEFGPLDWIASGFRKTAGVFRIGKSEVDKTLNSFSHQVKWKKGQRGGIQIFPMKGDVWALYSNWSPDWDECTEDEIVHKYDLVVVLEDYIEDKGVLVAPLVKVAGFTSVFKQVLNHRESRTIPREEMFRFSHQVPLYMLNGLEAENAPKDCYELDPAALPLELLKVMTDAEIAESEIGSKVHNSGEPAERRSFEDTRHMFQYSRRNEGEKVEGSFFQSLNSTSLDAC